MGQTHDHVTPKLRAFIERQKLFFVATAPLSADGHVNVSPKGYDSVVFLDDRTMAYLDLGGSGIETQAHVQENGRITLMWCAFDGPADIVRVYGRGEAVPMHDARFPELLALFPGHDRARAIIVVQVESGGRQLRLGRPLLRVQGRTRPAPALGGRQAGGRMGGASVPL